MRKRTLAMLLCLVMVSCLGAGYTGAEGDGGALSGKIVVGGWPAGDDAFKAIIPGFNELYPGIEVELVFQQGSDYNQMLQTSISSGFGAPDVAMLEQAWVGRYKDSPGFENLLEEPYFAESMKDDFVEFKWNLALSTDKTRLVGLVWDIGPATMFYRRDVFADAGLPTEPDEIETLMSTWDGVLQVAEAVHIPGERWLVARAESLYMWYFLNRPFYDDKLNFSLDVPGAKEALEAAITMRKNGWDAQIVDTWNETNAALDAGKLAMNVAGCWYGGFLKNFISPDTSGLWGVARLPGGIPDSNNGGSYVGIPTQSQVKDQAWAFIKYSMATNEGQNGMFKAVDYFPGFIPSWADPMYDEADDYFGGQKARALWVDISQNVQTTYSTLMDAAVEDILNNEVNSGLNQGLSADDIIERLYKAVEEGTKQDYERNLELLQDAGLM